MLERVFFGRATTCCQFQRACSEGMWVYIMRLESDAKFLGIEMGSKFVSCWKLMHSSTPFFLIQIILSAHLLICPPARVSVNVIRSKSMSCCKASSVFEYPFCIYRTQWPCELVYRVFSVDVFAHVGSHFYDILFVLLIFLVVVCRRDTMYVQGSLHSELSRETKRHPIESCYGDGNTTWCNSCYSTSFGWESCCKCKWLCLHSPLKMLILEFVDKWRAEVRWFKSCERFSYAWALSYTLSIHHDLDAHLKRE